MRIEFVWKFRSFCDPQRNTNSSGWRAHAGRICRVRGKYNTYFPDIRTQQNLSQGSKTSEEHTAIQKSQYRHILPAFTTQFRCKYAAFTVRVAINEVVFHTLFFPKTHFFALFTNPYSQKVGNYSLIYLSKARDQNQSGLAILRVHAGIINKVVSHIFFVLYCSQKLILYLICHNENVNNQLNLHSYLWRINQNCLYLLP